MLQNTGLALCSDDYRYLGVPDGSLRSSWAHCSDIVREANRRALEIFSARHPIRSGRTRCPLLPDVPR